jgi:hypothetical protein
MSSNVVNQVPYLRNSREFPEQIEQLCVEVNKAYIDTSSAVNNRTIAIFPTMRPAINGESWFLTSQKQQALRQVYTFTTTANIPHNITNVVPGQFLRGFGSYTDGTNTYGLIYGSNVVIAGQISFYVTSTNIVFLVGAGSPAVTSGRVILEWLSSP